MKDHSTNLFLRDGDKEEIIRCLLEIEGGPLKSTQYTETDCDNKELNRLKHS